MWQQSLHHFGVALMSHLVAQVSVMIPSFAFTDSRVRIYGASVTLIRLPIVW